MAYTVKQLADMAGVSVRTLHYYDQLGLLRPQNHTPNGYRQYGQEAVVRLQQIMFFRELGFSLSEIKDIVNRPDFDVLRALETHRALLLKKAQRLNDLIATVDRTISNVKGELSMKTREYYLGFSEEQVKKYRDEVRERWGQEALISSEVKLEGMTQEEFAGVKGEGEAVFASIRDNMSKGYASPEVQQQIGKWRLWLGRMYSQNPEFAGMFRSRYHPDLPQFLTGSIEYYVKQRQAGNK
jgi:MerR family transcriptional regulator, thiopeptide resistance regulator